MIFKQKKFFFFFSLAMSGEWKEERGREKEGGRVEIAKIRKNERTEILFFDLDCNCSSVHITDKSKKEGEREGEGEGERKCDDIEIL